MCVLDTSILSTSPHCVLVLSMCFGCAVSLLPCAFPLDAVSGSYSLLVVLGLLVVTASLVAEHGLQGMRASAFAAQGFRCPAAWEIFSDQGSNRCPLHCKVDS